MKRTIVKRTIWLRRVLTGGVVIGGVLAAGVFVPGAMPQARALDLTGGVMEAVPTKNNQPPFIDGDLKDWDLSREEPIWVAPQTARDYHATVALNYDNDALYVGARVSLPNRGIVNPNNPVDAFW